MMNTDTNTATTSARNPSVEGRLMGNGGCTTAVPWLIVTARAGASINSGTLLEADDELRSRWSWRSNRLAEGEKAVLIPRRGSRWR